jgi:hypothetical protein
LLVFLLHFFDKGINVEVGGGLLWLGFNLWVKGRRCFKRAETSERRLGKG